MFTHYRFLSKIPHLLPFILVCCSFLNAASQAKPGAQHTRTWIIQEESQIKISAPPGKEQTLKELAEIKLYEAKRNEKVMQQIQYWDAGSPAYRWNELAYQLTTFENFNTFIRSPMAWMNLAIYDATNMAWNVKNTYQRKRPHQTDPSIQPAVTPPATPSYPCEHSVTAAAAAHVLAYFYPEKADSVLKLAKEAAQSRIMAGVQYPSDVTGGWKLGEQIAALVIEQAKKDGSDKPWTGTIPNDPKLWNGPYPVGITAAGFQPLVLQSADQFRPPAPGDFSGDMKALKNFTRNSQSDYLALYWASHTGVDFWTELASKKIFEYRLDKNPPECARIYTLLHVAIHDASIAIMDAKYAYWGIRPFQFDKTYKPLIETPPFPGYPSGHATASSTAATILAYFFPADAEFFRSKAKECADSRFYAGIHFESDNVTGLAMGAKLGQYIIDTWVKKEYAAK